MIFITSDGEPHTDLKLAQEHELKLLLQWKEGDASAGVVSSVVGAIVGNADKVMDILTTSATSKPRARKVNGGSKKRKPVEGAVTHVPESK